MKTFIKEYSGLIGYAVWFVAMSIAFWWGGFYWFAGVLGVGLFGAIVGTTDDNGGTYG